MSDDPWSQMPKTGFIATGQKCIYEGLDGGGGGGGGVVFTIH